MARVSGSQLCTQHRFAFAHGWKKDTRMMIPKTGIPAYTVVLTSKIVNFFTKPSDIADPPMAERERAILGGAVAPIWLAALPPCDTMGTGPLETFHDYSLVVGVTY